MKRASLMVLVLLLAWVAPSRAFADEKQVCNDAYQQAQVLRDQHKLVKAREQLLVCARAECPGFIAKDCAEWLKDASSRIPSIVLMAKNPAGADVTDVTVTLDGAPLVTKLDGIAVDVDPGPHTLTFSGADGKAEKTIVVPEGAKAQQIAVTFGAGGGVAVVTATPGTTAGAPAATGTASSVFSEPVDSGLSFGVRLGYGISVGSATANSPLSDTASGQVPIWFDAGYLVNPYLYLGLHLSYGIATVTNTALEGECGQPTVSCSGGVLRFGVDLQYRILGKNPLQPWIGLGVLGYESASISGSGPGGSGGGSVTGVEWVSPQAGFDYKFLPTLSGGGFIGATLAEYFGSSEDIDGVPQASTINGHALHGFVFLGVRANFDLHI